MKHRTTILALALCSLLVAPCFTAQGQQPRKIVRIGFLDQSNAAGNVIMLKVFRDELSKLGLIEGENLSIEYRFAEQKPERLPELAEDLVRLKVDLIVVSEPSAASAAKNATTTIPIVMTNVGDPRGRRFSCQS